MVASGIASLYLAGLLFALESSIWWNTVKVIAVLIPAILWAFLWFMLAQLQSLPEHVKSLSVSNDTDPNNLLSGLQQTAKESRGIFRVIRLLWQVKSHEGMAAVIESVGGLGLLLNPLFLIVMGVTGIILLLFILLAILLLVF